MGTLNVLAMAARALRAHVFRSFLTVLSITIGTFAIVLMSSLADSGLATIRFGIEDLGGARLLMFFPKDPERAEQKQASYARGFTREDRAHIAAALPHVTVQAVFAGLGSQDITSDTEETARTDLVAGDSRFFEAYKMPVAHGRLFSDEEDQQHARVCVAGHKLAKKLFPGDAVGHKVTVGSLRCRVVGVLQDHDRFGVRFGFDWTDLLVVPLETAADAFPSVRRDAGILLKTDDARHNDPVKRIGNAVLTDRHHGVDDFTIYDFSSIMEKFSTMFAVMRAIVGLVAGVALLIGGIGVMNMMLVSVSERVREIGIRKALGASPADIRAQFLTEALLLSFTGGVIGVAAGVLAATGATLVIHGLLPAWVGGVSRPAVVVAFVVSIAIGAVFGYFPARRAGRLDPTEAMRR
jgi:putative ABC transport system permease protein